MLIEPTVSHEGARALFDAVHAHWRELPVAARPALYLHGLGLGSDLDGAPWGPLRVVYVQDASDPITFLRTDAWWREPEWLQGERGPDVSPLLRWYPVVTFVQLAADMGIALAPPIGFGHDFHPHHYIDAWLAVTDPPAWDDARTEALKAAYADAAGW